MSSMPTLDVDLNLDFINLDFLESPERSESNTSTFTNFKSPLKGTSLHDPVNKVLQNPLEARKLEESTENYLNVSKIEVQDFNINFLGSPPQDKTNVNPLSEFLMENPPNSSIKIETENAQCSIKLLSKRIADVDELVRKLKHADEEKEDLQKQLQEFNRNLKDIQLLYNKEKSEHAQADVENKALLSKCHNLEIDLAAKSLELDQVQAILEENNGPLSYSELAIRYIKLAQKLEEERLLHWHDQKNVKDITKFCKDKGIKIPAMTAIPRSPPKRKVSVRKVNAEVQCELLTTIVASIEKEIEKPIEILKRNQETQYESIKTRNQGCQHIGTTTTRGTTTACFFKYHDVGTITDKEDDSEEIDMALNYVHKYASTLRTIYTPISPIQELIMPTVPTLTISKTIYETSPPQAQLRFNTIGTNTKPEDIAIQRKKHSKSIGTCTYICNVRRDIDFITQPTEISIKRSDSRPPSATNLLYEPLKNELNSNSINASPINNSFQSNNNRIPLPRTLEPNSFYDMWQICGHMFYGLLQRPMTNMETSVASNITQQEFFNYLNTLLRNDGNTTESIQFLNRNPNLSNLTPSELMQILRTVTTTERTDSHIPNSSTPLIFSNAVPSQSAANIIKPTAQRSSLNKSSCNEETDLTNQNVSVRKNVGTSPIQCLQATQKGVSGKHSSETSIKSPSKNKSVKLHENLTNERNSSAFSSPNKKEKILNKYNHKDKEMCASLNNSKINKLKICNLKSKHIKKQRRKSMMTETAVDFVATLNDSQKQSCSKDCRVSEQQNSDPERTSTKKSKIMNCKNKTLRRLNHKLFDSSTDTDDEPVTESDINTLNRSSSNEMSCSSSSSFDSNFNSPDTKEGFSSLQIVANDFPTETDENLTRIVSEQKQASVDEIKDSYEKTNRKIDEINSNTSSETSLIIDENVQSSSGTSPESPLLPKRRGRKRKNDTSSDSPYCPSPVKTPCKRSPRLLTKNTNLDTQISKQYNLPLLSLDNKTILTKSNRKQQSISSSSFNANEKLVEKSLVEAKAKQIENPKTLREFEKVATKCSLLFTSSSEKSSTLYCPKSKSLEALEELQKVSNNLNYQKELPNTSNSSFRLPLISTKSIYSSPYGCKPVSSSMTNICTSLTYKNAQNGADFMNSKTIRISSHISDLNSTSSSGNISSSPPQISNSSHSLNSTTSSKSRNTPLQTPNLTSSLFSLDQQSPFDSSMFLDAQTQNSTQSSDLTNSLNIQKTSDSPSILISPKTTNSFLTSISPKTPINFKSPPASPTPLDNNEIQSSPLKIPLELSKVYFPNVNWRPKSLLHNLIDCYDESQYHSFHGEQLNQNESQQIKRMEVHLDEYIKETTNTEITTKTKFDVTALNLVQKLQSITSNETKLIARAIVKTIQKATRPPVKDYEPFITINASTSLMTTTPIHDDFINQNFSTKAHQSIFYVFQHFSLKHFEELLFVIETTLFNVKTSDCLTLNDVLNITDLYLLILHQQQKLQNSTMQLNPARLFIAKCLYYHKLKAYPMIYAVLGKYPTVLPHREERNYDHSDPLISVIKHCLMCTKYDVNNSDLQQRELLSKLRFEYHFEPFKPDYQETLKNLIDKLCAGKCLNLKFAFAVFCKRLPPQRVISEVVEQHFIPLANEYYRLIKRLPDYEMRLSTLIDCFSTVIKPFPRDPRNPICAEVKNYFSFLKNFLNLNEHPIVKEAALHAILRLQRFDYISCYQALAHLRFDFKLQPNTKAALKTFIYRKPKCFWKTLQMQNC